LQVVNLLGPKTEADLAPPPAKKGKDSSKAKTKETSNEPAVGKPAAAQPAGLYTL